MHAEKSKVIAVKILLIQAGWYALEYVWYLILYAAMGLTIDGRGPFDFVVMNPSVGGAALANWLTLFLSYVLSPLLMVFIARVADRTWDYASTMTFLHLLISMAVMGAFPVNYIFWLTALLSTLWTTVLGKVLCRVRDYRNLPDAAK